MLQCSKDFSPDFRGPARFYNTRFTDFGSELGEQCYDQHDEDRGRQGH